MNLQNQYTQQKALHNDEIHIWYGCLAQGKKDIHKFEFMLSEDELERAGKYHFIRDKHSFIVSRGILRCLLACYLDIEPQKVLLHYNRYGKPYLASNYKIQFNLSHSADTFVIAFSKERLLGIDIEKIRTISDVSIY